MNESELRYHLTDSRIIAAVEAEEFKATFEEDIADYRLPAWDHVID